MQSHIILHPTVIVQALQTQNLHGREKLFYHGQEGGGGSK